MDKKEALNIIGAYVSLDSDVSRIIDFESLIFLWRHALNNDNKTLVEERIVEVLSQTIDLSELIILWTKSAALQTICVLTEKRMAEVFSAILPDINCFDELIPLWRHSPESIKILIEKRILEIPD
ncbi:MAG TPA: hypothetical protein PLQ44_02110 [Candidatus Paceibacterota bacterium]|mgnify:CR=1 FL=1|jgi:hypothetical protein|nr:hypothetical protein [Candidatus Paceibacterota bacterium]HPT40373.1 hypothetical protein [Candidatus Paceibacterota bacterium]